MTLEMMEIEYNRARRLIETNEYLKLVEAKDILVNLNDYKDSAKYLSEINSKINVYESEIEIKKEEKYLRAKQLIGDKKTSQKLDQAIKLFKELEDYKDSRELLDKTIADRKKIMVKDKKNLDRFKLLGYLFASIGLIVIVLVICGIIWIMLDK